MVLCVHVWCCLASRVLYAAAPKVGDGKVPTLEAAVSTLQLLSFLVRNDKLARVLPVDVTCADGPSVATVTTALCTRLTAALTTALPPFAADVALPAAVATPPPAKQADLPEHLLSARWSLLPPPIPGRYHDRC